MAQNGRDCAETYVDELINLLDITRTGDAVSYNAILSILSDEM